MSLVGHLMVEGLPASREQVAHISTSEPVLESLFIVSYWAIKANLGAKTGMRDKQAVSRGRKDTLQRSKHILCNRRNLGLFFLYSILNP